tara:strand:- start:14702 stop:14866 length:165 start_codon:yes stop_codon:yes gene_type:complete
MGMDLMVEGFRTPDEKWGSMKKVWDACVAAGTSIPVEVHNYFNGTAPTLKKASR